MSEDMLALARKIHDEQCMHCKAYKPKNKNYCGVARQILVPLLQDGRSNAYAAWLFNRVPYKDGVCASYKKKVD